MNNALQCPRPEYPRPQLVRPLWQSLNGQWNFAFDDGDQGLDQKWYMHPLPSEEKILVPFVYECEMSGIGDKSFHEVVWYQREFSLDAEWENKEILLHLGAVDYEAMVFLNGCFVGSHVGPDAPSSLSLTPFLRPGVQTLTLRVYDPCRDETIPHGKQYWLEKPEGIWYTGSVGIWQSVWLEAVPKTRIEEVRFTSLFDQGKEEIRVFFANLPRAMKEAGAEKEREERLSLHYLISLSGSPIAEGTLERLCPELVFDVDLIQNHIFSTNFHNDGISWTPEHPTLFDVDLELKDSEGNVLDAVTSYFGFRKVHAENQMIYLNNKPYFQKLVLDQGYWPESLMTAPTDEALKKDIELAKALGFNGCRKHQKAEDPRFLYWADRLGYLVWAECASIPTFGERQVKREMDQWARIMARDYNHPSIVAWVPLNESWGIPGVHGDKKQQHYSQTFYHYLHALDETRLVISNDGWEMTETDICAIHNYAHGEAGEEEKYADFCGSLATRKGLLSLPPCQWDIYAQGFSDQGAPIVLSEFGGIGYTPEKAEGGDWGYTLAHGEEEFIQEYTRVMKPVFASHALAGYCYTQLTDVEQEVNGLYTYDRRPKADVDRLREANSMYRRFRIALEE